MPDPDWERSQFGRIEQARRELSAALRKEVTMKTLAGLVRLEQSSLSEWKTGESKPKRENVLALAQLFARVGLDRFSYEFLSWRPTDVDYVEPERFQRPPKPPADTKRLRKVIPTRGKPRRKEA